MHRFMKRLNYVDLAMLEPIGKAHSLEAPDSSTSEIAAGSRIFSDVLGLEVCVVKRSKGAFTRALSLREGR